MASDAVHPLSLQGIDNLTPGSHLIQLQTTFTMILLWHRELILEPVKLVDMNAHLLLLQWATNRSLLAPKHHKTLKT